MSGPWEKYNAPAGPWAKYQQAPATTAEPATPAEPSESIAHRLSRGLVNLASGPVGLAETLAQAGSGTAASAVAGLTGAGQAIKNVVAPNFPSIIGDMSAADRVQQIQDKFTYQPRTEAGQQTAAIVNYPFQKLAQGADAAGGFVTDVTGSPLLGAGVNALIQGAPTLLLPEVGRLGVIRVNGPRIAPAGRALARDTSAPNIKGAVQAERPAGLAGVPEAAPTAEALKTASKQAYKRSKEIGAVVKPESFAMLQRGLASRLQKEGLNAKLHPKASAALEEIENTKGPVSLEQIDTLRKIARDAEADFNPTTKGPTPDAQKAGIIVDALDSYTNALSSKHLSAGTTEAAAALKEARGLYARASKSATISDMIDRAQTKAGAHFTQAGMEHALRQEFKQLALNPKRMRFFTKAEQGAIKGIARGTPLENTLRNLGKFDPFSSLVAAIPNAMALAAAGPAGLALPAAGFAAKRVATRITKNKVAALDEMVRRGPPARKNNLAPTTRRRNALSGPP